jgi:hypothetical protein
LLDQRRALHEWFPHHRNATAVLEDKKAEAATVRELREWIEREIHLDVANAPFGAQDERRCQQREPVPAARNEQTTTHFCFSK